MGEVEEIIKSMSSFSNGAEFFYEVRHRSFTYESGLKYINFLKRIDFSGKTEKEMKSILAYLWQVPFLLRVWREMNLEYGADPSQYDDISNKVERIIVELSRLFYTIK